MGARLMRIISGAARGRTLSTRKGMATRPTADRVKEAMFSVLADRVEEARVLDAFAGSGALGLEARSRGAAEVHFTEKDRAAAAVVAKNIELCRFEACHLHIGDCIKLLPALCAEEGFDLIFADPPYNKGLLNRLMEQVAACNALRPHGVLIAETTVSDSEFAPDLRTWTVAKSSTYGDTAVHYCQIIK